MIISNSQIVTGTTGQFRTRADAINTAVEIADSYGDIINALDDTQEFFGEEKIESQFFSQSQSYVDSAEITAQSIKFLLISAYDLNIERRFILKLAKSAIRVCIEEYGDIGLEDEIFQLFVESNNLQANEILFLQPGREIVVYG